MNVFDVKCVNLLIAFDNSAGPYSHLCYWTQKFPGILIPLDSSRGNIWREGLSMWLNQHLFVYSDFGV